MNYSELNNQETNKDIFNNQGMEYIKFRNKKKEVDSKNLSFNNDNGIMHGILEGFSSTFPENAVNDKNSSEFKDVVKLQTEYQKILSEYSSVHKELLSKISQYFKIKDSKIINKNIRLNINGSGSKGQIGYVTNDGVFKHYPSWSIYQNTAGKNGCPADFINVDARNTGYRILFNDKNLPDLKLGTPMQTGQSCGFEGNNVFVTEPGTIGVTKYEGCYNNSSSGLIKSEQQVPYNEEGFNRCKQFAHDTGNSVFAVSRDGDNMNCYVGKDINKVKEGGISIIPIQSWASPQVNGILARLNSAGQLLIEGNSTTQSNIIDGLKCKVYTGYMNDNPQFFKGATVLNTTAVNVLNFTNISTATNNLFPGNTPSSVEWIGYIKANVSGNWTFYLNSDDCSYMWIGNTAIAEYTTTNSFINNSGLHAPKVVSRSIALTAGKYYPIRIQFGQNQGGYAFDLKIQKPDGSNGYDSKELFFSTPDPFNSPLYPETGESLETLWKSNDPQGSCHETYGGKINLTDSISTWGYNCNARNTDAWGRPASYSVPLGNMNDTVMNNVNNKVNATVIVGSGMNDVAQGCAKNFSSNYRCGNGQIKNIYMRGEASGRNATYNCINQDNACNFVLSVQDDGNLVIYKQNYNFSTKKYSWTPIWYSGTHTKIDKVDESKKAEKGKNGRNYLLPGETLNDGEFIGSNNGKCFLIMTKGIGLQLFYNKLNCSPDNDSNINNNITRLPNSNSPSNETLAVYTLPNAKGLESISTVSYIDSEGQLNKYSENMIEKGTTYFDLGDFNNPGNDIKQIPSDNPELCKQECNKLNDCDGFVFNENNCYLKNSNMYPKSNRFASPGVKLFKRSVNVKNNNSCTKNISAIDAERWNSYIKKGDMTQNELCGLGKHIGRERIKVDKVISRLNDVVKQINGKMSSLTENDKKLLEQYGINSNKIKEDLLKINLLEQEYSASKGKINNIHGMKTSSETELIHNNYNYMLWSILAVLVVIGGMKILKK